MHVLFDFSDYFCLKKYSFPLPFCLWIMKTSYVDNPPKTWTNQIHVHVIRTCLIKKGNFFFLFRIPDNGTKKNKILYYLLQSNYDWTYIDCFKFPGKIKVLFLRMRKCLFFFEQGIIKFLSVNGNSLYW